MERNSYVNTTMEHKVPSSGTTSEHRDSTTTENAILLCNQRFVAQFPHTMALIEGANASVVEYNVNNIEVFPAVQLTREDAALVLRLDLQELTNGVPIVSDNRDNPSITERVLADQTHALYLRNRSAKFNLDRRERKALQEQLNAYREFILGYTAPAIRKTEKCSIITVNSAHNQWKPPIDVEQRIGLVNTQLFQGTTVANSLGKAIRDMVGANLRTHIIFVANDPNALTYPAKSSALQSEVSILSALLCGNFKHPRFVQTHYVSPGPIPNLDKVDQLSGSNLFSRPLYECLSRIANGSHTSEPWTRGVFQGGRLTEYFNLVKHLIPGCQDDAEAAAAELISNISEDPIIRSTDPQNPLFECTFSAYPAYCITHMAASQIIELRCIMKFLLLNVAAKANCDLFKLLEDDEESNMMFVRLCMDLTIFTVVCIQDKGQLFDNLRMIFKQHEVILSKINANLYNDIPMMREILRELKDISRSVIQDDQAHTIAHSMV